MRKAQRNPLPTLGCFSIGMGTTCAGSKTEAVGPTLMMDSSPGSGQDKGMKRRGKHEGLFETCLRMGLAILLTCSVASQVSQAQEPSIWERQKLTGTWNGARTALEEAGLEIGVDYLSETLNVLSGGVRRGTVYEGFLDVIVNADLERLAGWTGARAHIRGLQVHTLRSGAGPDAGSFADPINVTSYPTTRLQTAWFEQSFGAFASFRIGQLAADEEFFTSETAGGLLNGTFGWPNIVYVNLPSGGPANPLATPGARLRVNVSDRVSLMGGVFSGDPIGSRCRANNPGAEQACHRNGLAFSFSGGAFWIGEIQYDNAVGEGSSELVGAYKLGVWRHTGAFANQRFGIDGDDVVSLALDPDSPLNHRGNWGVYGVVDQMVWRGADSSVSIFARVGVSPSNRNLISWYVDGGIGVKGPLPNRDDDVLTFGLAHTGMGRAAIDLDLDRRLIDGSPLPIRSGEMVLEMSYAARLAPWWLFQPSIQYIVRPKGNVAGPDDPLRAVDNAFLIGFQNILNF